jgi:membrane protein implicated in regulation of membrane protease activity
MDMLAETAALLDQLAAWHWFTLGVILLALEIASTTNYLLWPGIAAILIGALKFVAPGLDGALSLFLFAVLAVATTVAWQRSPYGKAQSTAPNNLNARMDTYLGRKGVAAGDFVGGEGAILLDDTRWVALVTDGSSPRNGDVLQVTGADGTVLRVRAAA